MEKNIKISAILPSLNVRKYIEETIESVIDQTITEIEIICIDAGSTDGTFEVILDYAKKDKRIIPLQSPIKSYGVQVNYGIDVSNGKYISIVETDDYIDPNMFEVLYYTAEKYNCDYVKSDYYAYFSQDDGSRFFLNRKTFLNDDLYESVICPKDYAQVATDDWYLWQGIYSKEFIIRNHIKFSETAGAAYQDIGFLYQTTICAERAMYKYERYYKYCIDREGSSSNIGKGLEYSYQEFRRLYDLLIPETDIKMKVMYYARMSKSLVCCFSEIAEGNSKLDTGDIEKYYSWFKEKLDQAIGEGIISENNIHNGIWTRLISLLNSKDGIERQLNARNKLMREKLGIRGRNRIVIFGCGNYGYGAYKWLIKEGYQIDFFMDNDQSLWGKRLNGIVIENPNEAKNGFKYVVANEKYWKQIKEQLVQYGIDEDNILIFD